MTTVCSCLRQDIAVRTPFASLCLLIQDLSPEECPAGVADYDPIIGAVGVSRAYGTLGPGPPVTPQPVASVEGREMSFHHDLVVS